jgi:hypothetical protein
MNRAIEFFAVSILFSFSTSAAQSAETAFGFQVHNQNPLIAIYNLPLPTSAKLLNKSEFQTDWIVDISNTLNIESNSNEQLLIDGESHQLNLSFAYGLNDDLNLKVTIPFISHSSGFLDSAIENFHDLLGLNPGLRPSQAKDRLLYTYSKDDAEQSLFLDSATRGVGDVSVQLAYQLADRENYSVSLWGSLALPTGDVKKLTGSGSSDIAFWTSANYKLNPVWQVFGSVGILGIDKNRFYELQNETVVEFAEIGLQWQLNSILSLKAQLDMHTVFFEQTDLRFLSDVVQLSFGGSMLLGPNKVLDFAISEDIKVNASPDVGFHIALHFLH